MKTDDLKALEQRAQSKLSSAIDKLQGYRYFGRVVAVVAIFALIGVVAVLRSCA